MDLAKHSRASTAYLRPATCDLRSAKERQHEPTVSPWLPEGKLLQEVDEDGGDGGGGEGGGRGGGDPQIMQKKQESLVRWYYMPGYLILSVTCF